jgi:hypothetical protein
MGESSAGINRHALKAPRPALAIALADLSRIRER